MQAGQVWVKPKTQTRLGFLTHAAAAAAAAAAAVCLGKETQMGLGLTQTRPACTQTRPNKVKFHFSPCEIINYFGDPEKLQTAPWIFSVITNLTFCIGFGFRMMNCGCVMYMCVNITQVWYQIVILLIIICIDMVVKCWNTY